MKYIEFPVPSFYEEYFFQPIRDQLDYIKVVLYASRLFLINFQLTQYRAVPKLKLIKNRHSRLFFINANKYYSIAYPFLFEILENSPIRIYDKLGTIIDSELISKILSIINEVNDNITIIDSVLGSTELTNSTIKVLEILLQAESGYIRFDHDPDRENGKLHPLFHFDVNFSSISSYKIGIDKNISDTNFENFLDRTTDCEYIYFR